MARGRPGLVGEGSVVELNAHRLCDRGEHGQRRAPADDAEDFGRSAGDARRSAHRNGHVTLILLGHIA